MKYTQKNINNLIVIDDDVKIINSVNFNDCDLSNLDLGKIKFINCKFAGANLWSAYLGNANLSGADLIRANLTNAYLSGARLWRTIGNGKQIKNVRLPRYSITYTTSVLQIGCVQFKIEEFKHKTDQEISEMDIGALEWWNKYKEETFRFIDKSPAF